MTLLNKPYYCEELEGADRYKKLYHYTSFDIFVKIWDTKKLKFGEVANVNDILETNKGCQATNSSQMLLLRAFCDIRATYKQISFTMDYDSKIKGSMSSMMWGVYGDKRKGICIELDFSKLKFSENCLMDVIEYKQYVSMNVTIPLGIVTKKDVRKFIKEQATEIFFTKQMDWKGENEFRVVSDFDDYLDVTNAISAIYLTSYESNECLMAEKLVNEQIPVYCIHYPSSGDNIAIPRCQETKRRRYLYNDLRNEEDNAMLEVERLMEEHYESVKNDENARLVPPDDV